MAFLGMHVHAFAAYWMPISLGAWLGHWEKIHIAAQSREIRENVTQQGEGLTSPPKAIKSPFQTSHWLPITCRFEP